MSIVLVLLDTDWITQIVPMYHALKTKHGATSFSLPGLFEKTFLFSSFQWCGPMSINFAQIRAQ